MNYVVIDLEMCKVPKQYQSKYNYSKEIIEIGAVLLDQEYQVIGTQKQFVCPEHGVVDRFISNLTGRRTLKFQSWQSVCQPEFTDSIKHKKERRVCLEETKEKELLDVRLELWCL